MNAQHRSRNRKFILSGSEVMTILILFHLGNFKTTIYTFLLYEKNRRSLQCCMSVIITKITHSFYKYKR